MSITTWIDKRIANALDHLGVEQMFERQTALLVKHISEETNRTIDNVGEEFNKGVDNIGEEFRTSTDNVFEEIKKLIQNLIPPALRFNIPGL